MPAPFLVHAWQKSQCQDRDDSTSQSWLWFEPVSSLFPPGALVPGRASGLLGALSRLGLRRRAFNHVWMMVSMAPPTPPPTNWPTTTFQSTPPAADASA